jgi:exodeoxyribonuclease VIII
MKPGIYTMPDEKYFKIEAASNSGLKQIARSPAHYRYEQDHPKEPSPQMKAGSAGHCAVLEPDEFMNRYAVLPDNAPDKPTKPMLAAFAKGSKQPQKSLDRIQFWSQFEKMHTGKEIISNEVAAQYLHVGTLVRNHPELSIFFETGKAEQAIFANDPKTGVLCKCKPDYLTKVKQYKVMIELKSTEDARPEFFNRKAFNFGYFQGAAWYTDLMAWADLGAPDLYLMVVYEQEPPHGIKIYEMPPEAIEYGQRRYREALDIYAYCLETDTWPNYDTTIETLSLPGWVKD